MELHGRHLIGASTSQEGEATFTAVDPTAKGEGLAPAYAEATPGEVTAALELAAAAHPSLEEVGREQRARFLETVAAGLEELGDELLERAAAETALPLPRLTAERGRTCGQLRLFAHLLREGSYLDLRIDHADPERKPLPKPDVRSIQRALGPVAVFGASNFPLAFSVAGGDSAAALAAGCPVVVKAHPNHPGTSEMVGAAIVQAARSKELPPGTFSLLHGRSHEVGQALATHELTRAVAFTGSLAGGRALFDIAARRPEPIPVYAEMGDTNPVFFLPEVLAASASDLATALAQSVTLGVGQFCTNPGLVFVVASDATETFLSALADGLRVYAGTMLHAGIRESYDHRLHEVTAVDGVEVLVRSDTLSGACTAGAALLRTAGQTFRSRSTLHEEVFGPSTLVVVCEDEEELRSTASGLPGQLTVTVHGTEGDLAGSRALLRILEQKTGRLLYGGFPTGVEVCEAMVHGGPYPATTDARTTSVGTMAIRRFLRPVCYQSFPSDQLPRELRDDAPAGLLRLVDGEWTRS